MACNHKAYTIYDELLREKKLIESLWLIGINRIRIKKKKKKKKQKKKQKKKKTTTTTTTTWKIHNLINFDSVGFFWESE